MVQQRIVTLVGGSGFLGTQLVKQLAERGWTVQILSRDAERARELKTAGSIGQIVCRYVDITKPETFEGALKGNWAVVNLVGILFEGGQKFDAVQAKAPGLLAQEAAKAGVTRFVQISALGADSASDSLYARTKAAGEDAVRAAFPHATIIRPGLIFGHGDGFFAKFASLSRFLPFLPLIGGGATRFQPVYVGDVAEAIANALELSGTEGKIYELGGPQTYSFKELLQMIGRVTRRRICLLPVPFALASLQAALLGLLPNPLLTRDQVKLLRQDNVLNGSKPGLSDLGVKPTALELLLPEILLRYIKRASL